MMTRELECLIRLTEASETIKLDRLHLPHQTIEMLIFVFADGSEMSVLTEPVTLKAYQGWLSEANALSEADA